MPDSDRLVSYGSSIEGVREEVPTCETCFLFQVCSSNYPEKRAEGCYVSLGMLETVSLGP